MEYIYAGLLLHYAKKEITEENMEKIFQSTGISYDPNKLKMFVAAFNEINIEEALKSVTPITTVATAVATTTTTTTTETKPKEEKKEEKKEESEETLAAGLASLFG